MPLLLFRLSNPRSKYVVKISNFRDFQMAGDGSEIRLLISKNPIARYSILENELPATPNKRDAAGLMRTIENAT